VRQQARDLVAAVLDVPRFWPAVHHGRLLTVAEVEAIDAAAERLAGGMPFAYAVRRAPFRHLILHVDERVLIPRPETEVLVDLVLASVRRGLAIDVGTGSGCIALALATEGEFTRVIATDVAESALTVARLNHTAVAPRTPVDFRSGAFLAPCRGERATVVVSNPPYISLADAPSLPGLVRDWEPPTSLFAGDDGMAAITAIANDASGVLEPGGMLALEVDTVRAGRAADVVRQTGAYHGIHVRPDLTGRDRFVLARRAED
jgi:release factor glutamine methyltransferase